MARAELRIEDLTAICDTREQTPLDLAPMLMRRAGLYTGDYSVAGLESVITVERKSLPDLLACVGVERERFDKEMQRILAYPHKMLVVEATWADIRAGQWRSQVTPAAVSGSLLGWMARGIPIFFAADHTGAGAIVRHFLFLSARRRWYEATALVPHLKIAGEQKCSDGKKSKSETARIVATDSSQKTQKKGIAATNAPNKLEE